MSCISAWHIQNRHGTVHMYVCMYSLALHDSKVPFENEGGFLGVFFRFFFSFLPHQMFSTEYVGSIILRF